MAETWAFSRTQTVVRTAAGRDDAFLGALVGDAVAMPVHWYYDRRALDRDYGLISKFLAPKNPHPDSILWRSSYEALNERGDILHDEARYWGQRGIHYHQHLRAGENTLNYQLARLLYRQVTESEGYDAEAWLEGYLDFMLSPGRHRDTYVEECHRAFFTNYARGVAAPECGSEDGHIGGLAAVPALFSALPWEAPELLAVVERHVSLTHRHPEVLRAARTLMTLLNAVEAGEDLRQAIADHGADWISAAQLAKWSQEPDEFVIGQRLSPACYIDQAFPAALYLAWKYAGDFSAGICANARLGGDNCHRAAVVGSLLGRANGVPRRWKSKLVVSLREEKRKISFTPAMMIPGLANTTEQAAYRGLEDFFAGDRNFPAPDRSLRSITERGFYLIWLFYTIITFNVGCAGAGILLYDGCYYLTRGMASWPSGPNHGMMDITGELFLFALINLPICLAARYYGIIYCRFLLHESHFDALGDEADETFVSANALKIAEFLEQIRKAKAWDRQAARQQFRKWLEKHHGSLTAHEFSYLEEHFGYGMDPGWKRPRAESAAVDSWGDVER